MLSDEEKKMLEIFKKEVEKEQNEYEQVNEYTKFYYNNHKFILNLIEKQSKEIEELKETLKCTQNSWYEDTQKNRRNEKQIDLDNECEIALNSKVMDLEKEIEELKVINQMQKYRIEVIDERELISKDKEIEELKEKYSKKLIEFQKEREWYEKNHISKDKLIELREIDNIDLIQCKLRKLLEE